MQRIGELLDEAGVDRRHHRENAANPAQTKPAAYQDFTGTRSCNRNLRSARAKINSTTSSGCTTASSPKYNATPLSTNTPTANACPISQTGWRTRYHPTCHRDRSSGAPTPAKRARIAHDALQKPAPNAQITVSTSTPPLFRQATPSRAYKVET
jgi:hypothetical protein